VRFGLSESSSLFGTRRDIESLRPSSQPINQFQFGSQSITTKVNLMIPKKSAKQNLDVLSGLESGTVGKDVEESLLGMIEESDETS
jgi:hypothetical protein